MSNKFNFNPVNGLLDKNEFPTTPTSEDAARGQFMTLLNQLKDYLNNLSYETEYNVTLPSGLVLHSTFLSKVSKKIDGSIVINLSIAANTDNNNIVNGSTICTLPIEVRPTKRVVASCLVSRLGANPSTQEMVYIDSNGNVSLQCFNNTVASYCITFSVTYNI